MLPLAALLAVHQEIVLKVLILTDRYPPYDVGGAERIAYYHARALVERGHEVEVFTTYAPKRESMPICENIEGVRIHRRISINPFTHTDVPSVADRLHQLATMPWNPWMQHGLNQVAQAFKPDLIHAHYIPRISYGAFRRALPSAAHVVTFHGYQFECPRGGLYRSRGQICTDKPLPCRWFQKSMLRQLRGVDRVVAISRFIQKQLVQGGIPDHKIVYIPNGVPDLALREFTPPSQNRTVLFVGRATRAKGLLELCRAFRGISDLSARLVFVGDGELLPELKKVACGDSRIAIVGRLNAEEVAKHYQASRMVVVPSLWHEPMNTVICEAQSWSRPVIATRVGGNEDMILDGVSGLLCPPDDVPTLQSAIEKILSDDVLTDRIGRAGFEHVERFSMERHIASIEDLYRILPMA